MLSMLSSGLLSSGLVGSLVASHRHAAPQLQRLAVRTRALSMLQGGLSRAESPENDQGAAYAVQKSEVTTPLHLPPATLYATQAAALCT